jgi:alpha-aminoadipic semialdehyde synthase
MIIGIRRADKNDWEQRVPLIPDDVKYLKDKYGIRTLIQPSKIRAYKNEEYENAGAEVVEDIQNANTIFAVKEIPLHFYRPDKTYIFFSHTIKGQEYNMPLLKKMMGLKCNLIDYERIVNEKNQRLIFFGKYAGIAGMIESLHALGQKLEKKEIKTPFSKIKQAYKYNSIEEARQELKKISDKIKKNGLPKELQPMVVGFAGYGNVSQGAQEIFDILPFKTITPEEISNINQKYKTELENHLFKVVFKEKDLVKPKNGGFELQDYYDHPEKYESNFEQYIPNLTVLVNCIYWTEAYPRLVTKKYLRSDDYLKSRKKLVVIGDISCDIDGSIEITNKATEPGDAFYTYFPDNLKYKNGIREDGITIMAVDNLPCEFPKEASKEFSSVLKGFVYEIANADYDKPFDEISLSYPIKHALILQRGELTKDYLYLNQFLTKG